MAKTMSLSQKITQGQIGKIQDLLGDKLRKNTLPFGPVQTVLETQGAALAHELWMVVQNRVDTLANMIVRHVKVDRKKTHQQMLNATSCRQYIEEKVMMYMPQGTGQEKDVYFFCLGRNATAEEVAYEYRRRLLVPDPDAQAQVNADDPMFAKEYPNASQWISDGCWRCITFFRWADVYSVDISTYSLGWTDKWWFAGVRKPL